MPHTRRIATLLLLALTAAACGERRPEFSPEGAQEQIADAFGLQVDEVSVLSDGAALAPSLPDAAAEWWVDFRLPVFQETLQARFAGREASWLLEGVRRRPARGEKVEWEDVGVMLGEARAAAAEGAARTEEVMRELAGAIEAYAVGAGNEYPSTDLAGLARLLTRGGYLDRWQHSDDGWGTKLHYYAPPGGQAYILISRGADNRFDLPLDAYQAKTDAGDFTYEGLTSDPDADLIYAVGSFVQRYEPGG